MRRVALLALAAAATIRSVAHGEVPAAPQLTVLQDSAGSHAFLAAAHQKQPLDLAALGYVESEYLVAGRARVFDWPEVRGAMPAVLGEGPYTTRILVRRPKDPRRFNGTVIVEPFNPSSPVDLPIMWAQSHEHFIADGFAWVGITIKPNTIRALKAFDPARYAAVAMPNPAPQPRCPASAINPNSQPTTPNDETGLAWDILSQVGGLLKRAEGAAVLGARAQRLYLTGQSQTAGYARTYATVFGDIVRDEAGRPLIDAYLYSGSPPWQVPLHQCRVELKEGDPRLVTPGVGVPIVELFAQGDIGTNLATRRPDADTKADRFRRYEIAGAPHVDAWEGLSFASDEDVRRATGGAPAAQTPCQPSDVTPSDFPTRYAFDAAWRNLDRWVRQGIPAPHAQPLVLKAGVTGAHFDPAAAFVEDANGNAVGGVRTPAVDVPTARWVGAKTGAFRCLFEGYKMPFDAAKRRELHGDQAAYVEKVRRSARALQAQGWLTAADAADAVRRAEAESPSAR